MYSGNKLSMTSKKAKLRWSYASFHLLAPHRRHYSEDKPDPVSFRSCSDTLSTRFQHKHNQVSKQPQRQMKWGLCKCTPYLVQNITRCLFIFRSEDENRASLRIYWPLSTNASEDREKHQQNCGTSSSSSSTLEVASTHWRKDQKGS